MPECAPQPENPSLDSGNREAANIKPALFLGLTSRIFTISIDLAKEFFQTI
jgi:hypothetical protein